MTGVATGFIPDRDITEDEISSMDSYSSDDEYPTAMLADIIDRMSTELREVTISKLRQMADENGDIKKNPIIAVSTWQRQAIQTWLLAMGGHTTNESQSPAEPSTKL